MQFLRSVFPIAIHDQLSSSSLAFVTFHIKYYFVKNKKDGKFIMIIIIYLFNKLLPN